MGSLLGKQPEPSQDLVEESQRYFSFVSLLPTIGAVIASTDDGIFAAVVIGLGFAVLGVIGAIAVRRRDGNASGYLLGTAFALSAVAYFVFLALISPTPGPGEDF